MTNYVDDTIKAINEVLTLIRRIRTEYPDAAAGQIAEAVIIAYDSRIEELLERIQLLQVQYEELQQHKSVMDAMANIVRLSDHSHARLRVAAE